MNNTKKEETLNDFNVNLNRFELFLQAKKLLENGDINQGKKYLESSISRGCTDAVNYYCCLLIKGEIIDQNILLAKIFLKRFLKKNDATVFYLYGKIMKKEGKYRESITYFKKSSKLGNAEAMYELGKLFLFGKGIAQDENQAMKYFIMSKKKGYQKSDKYLPKNTKNEQKKSKACIFTIIFFVFLLVCSPFLIHLYKRSQSNKSIIINDSIQTVSYDQEQTNLYLKKSADEGNFDAMFNYALHLYDGKGSDIDKKEASIYFKKAADNGLVDAMCNYAVMLLNGEGIEYNKEEGARYMKMAADKGFPLAMYFYAMLKENENQSPLDIKEAIKYYEKAIKKGSKEAMYRYGLLLCNGNGIKQNFKKGNDYIKKSADKGNLGAIITYGSNLLQGIGMEIDIINGLKYLKKASERVSVESLYGLMSSGSLPQSHISLNKAYNNSVEHIIVKILQLLVENEFPDAMYIYGSALLLGNGIQKNKTDAIKYFKMGSNLGDVDSLFSYAMILYLENNNLFGQEESLRLVKKAADLGHVKAKKMYSLMNKNIENVEFNLKELINIK